MEQAQPRIEPNYNYTPPNYAPPKAPEPYSYEPPKRAIVRPRDPVPPENPNDDRVERNRIARPVQPKPRATRPDEYGDDAVEQPWNRPVAKGVPLCPKPGQAGVCAHKVEAGETLSSIAQLHFGFGGPRTVARIAAVNPGLDPDRIYIGQVVYLPCGYAPQEQEPCTRQPVPIVRPAYDQQTIPITAF